ncbi:MAG: hypothetical protein RH982_15455 [Parvibaculum sp.]
MLQAGRAVNAPLPRATSATGVRPGVPATSSTRPASADPRLGVPSLTIPVAFAMSKPGTGSASAASTTSPPMLCAMKMISLPPSRLASVARSASACSATGASALA